MEPESTIDSTSKSAVETAGTQLAHSAEEADALARYLEEAQAAYEADDSRQVADLCREALKLDSDNPQAWDLLAKFGGWDSKLYNFDIDFAIDAAKRALDLAPESERFEQASEIYTARKHQIAHIFESEMMMPSFTASKQLHTTMMEWKRLLEEIPYLNASLIEGEVALCSNLCMRSKLAIMPGDRLVYTAYAEHNGKEPYGETFRKALAARLEEEGQRREQVVAEALERAKQAWEQAQSQLGSPQASADEAAAAKERCRQALQDEINLIEGLSNKGPYVDELAELETRLGKLGMFKYLKRKELGARIAAVQEKIAQIDEETERKLAPVREYLTQLEAL